MCCFSQASHFQQIFYEDRREITLIIQQTHLSLSIELAHLNEKMCSRAIITLLGSFSSEDVLDQWLLVHKYLIKTFLSLSIGKELVLHLFHLFSI